MNSIEKATAQSLKPLQFRRAYFLPSVGVWNESGENHYSDSNYKYHPAIDKILKSVVVTAATNKNVTFAVTVRDRVYSIDVHCTPAGNAKVEIDQTNEHLYVRLRRVFWTNVDLKVTTAMELFELFLKDAAEDTVARRKLAAAA
ncbi:hypothetical protein [Burkholderia anthina]|uniref:hypothetical protein n=1 Tax=Burkholderia anthina TaxID=179879 RepID=UPI0037BE7436